MVRGTRLARAALLAALAALAACRSDPEPPPPSLDVVFLDNYGPGVRYEAFSGVPSSATVSVDTTVKRTGTASLRVQVPATAYVGGAFPTETPRNLSPYNALVFWVRASQAATLNEVGLGNDNTGYVDYVATRRDVPLTTEWTRVVVPIPLPSKLVSEAGLLYLAEGSDEGAYTIWLDDVRYVSLPAAELALASADIQTEAVTRGVGETARVRGTHATFTVAGEEIEVEAAPRYFTFATSNAAVATVAADGLVTTAGLGTALVTARLGTADAQGALTVNVVDGNSPTVAAPTPSAPAADVISLFSDAYPAVGPATWSTTWDSADVSDVTIAGNAAKKYSNLVFAGIEPAATIDASGTTHFHLDVWTPDATTLKVKLVDFGADGAFGGGDDREHELVFNAGSTPALQQRTWVSLDLPLSAFTGLTTRGHVAQLILVGEAPPAASTTVYVDNVYFRRSDAPPPPPPPPGPAFPTVFGDAYTDGVGYAPFGGSTGAPVVDTAEHHSGTSSLRIDVPGAGQYVGGALVSGAAKDLRAYDAVTFWAKASKAATLNVIGLGNDAAGGTAFMAERGGVALTTSWTKVVLPLPDASRLGAERGLFHLAEGGDEGPYSIWIDDLAYETLGAGVLGAKAPAIATESVTRETGATFPVNGASVVIPVNGENQGVSASRRYFTWSSSAPAVATVDEAGVVTAVAPGTAEITASLGTVPAAGTTTFNVTAPSAPSAAAPTPTLAAPDVVSLFSDAYAAVGPVNWSTGWDSADVTDVSPGGNAAKRYSNLVFAGIEPAATIDATAMTHFHLDVWSADAATFKVKLVDFGANGTYEPTSDNSEHELVFDAASTPAMRLGEWVSLDIPLASFTGLTARGHVAQIILVGIPAGGGASTVYVDNVYFHK